jgi:hypothetical protein
MRKAVVGRLHRRRCVVDDQSARRLSASQNPVLGVKIRNLRWKFFILELWALYAWLAHGLKRAERAIGTPDPGL